MSDRQIRRAVYLLFFLSGACGLIYQIIWTRMMTIVFGITVYAVSTVLCSFMAGLALGSFFFGRRADTTRRPLVVYGWLEIGIGLFALAFPFLLKAVEPLFIGIHQRFYQSYHLFSLLRFSVVFPLLLLPTFLMGGTFPLVSRYFVRGGGSLGRDVGFLYAVNTTGAVAGTFMVGFVMLAYLGMWNSTMIAAALNVLVGVFSIIVGRHPLAARAEEEPVDPAGEDVPADGLHAAWSARVALVAIALSGFASLGLEVLWTRVLVFHTHNSTYAFSAMLLAFLLGIASGGWLYGLVASRARHPLVLFAALEAGIALWSIASLKIVGQLPRVTEFIAEGIHWNNWFETVVIIIAQVMLVLFVPTLLMGMTFPLATRLVTRGMGELGRKIGDVYSANTLGTVLGSLATGFALIPLLGVRSSFLVIAGVNALTAAGLLLAARGVDGTLRWLGAAGCVAMIAVAQFKVPKDAILNDFKRALGDVKFFEEEVTDTVMVVDLFTGPREARVPNKDFRMLVFADGRGTAGHPTVAEDRFYAHLPMLLHPAEKIDVLNICIGAGNTIGAFLQHERLGSITAVDLSPGVVHGAKFFETNYGVMNEPRDPRLTVVVEDGRNFLLGTDRKFDIIHLDPPEFHTAGVVFLYTEEFYRLVRTHLNPGGIFSHWFNASKLTAEEMRQVCATFHKVFPDGTNWHSPGLYSMNFIGSDRPLSIPLKRAIETYAREEKLRASFEAVRIGGPADLFSYLLMNSSTLGSYGSGSPIMTDDKTRVDFTNPKSNYSGFGFIHLYSPADMTKFYKLSDEEKAGRKVEVPDGGWKHMHDLTLKSDDAVALIDWTGIGEQEKAVLSGEIQAHAAHRKQRMEEYLKAQSAGW